MAVNEQQIVFWNGEAGEAWARRTEALDRVFAELTAAVLAAAEIRSGERVLDLGCGGGGMTIEAAAKCGPIGSATGIDVSTPMIRVARSRSGQAAEVRFVTGDAATFPFEPASLDVVISRLGAMFFQDPAAAFGSLRKAMAPEGRLAICVWRHPRENPWAMEPIGAVRQFVEMPPRPGPEDPGPFSFADPARVERILVQAGFEPPRLTPLEVDLPIGDSVEEGLGFTLEVGPLAEPLRKLTGEIRQRALDALSGVMANSRDEAGVVRPAGACWIVTTRSSSTTRCP